MTERFIVDESAVRGRAGIFDLAKGHRMVAFFLNDPANAEAAPRMARVCAAALNAAVAPKQQGGDHA